MTRIVLIAIFGALTVSACADWEGISESWRGHPMDDLVDSWGPPGGSYDYEDGRKAISYGHQHTIGSFNKMAPYQTTLYECSVTFTSDTAGVIITHKLDGNIGGCNSLFRNKEPAP